MKNLAESFKFNIPVGLDARSRRSGEKRSISHSFSNSPMAMNSHGGWEAIDCDAVDVRDLSFNAPEETDE